MNGFLTYKERIVKILNEKGKIYRKELAKELEMLPRNLNRDIDKLIAENKIEKGKEGKEIYYSIIQESPIESEILTESESMIKIAKREKYTQAQMIYDTLKRIGHEISRQELLKLTGIKSNNFGRRMQSNLRKGLVLKRKVGHNVYFRIAGIQPIKEVEQMTNLEVFINRIEPLKTFLSHHKNTLNHSDRTLDGYARIIILFYRWKDKFNEARFQIYPIERFNQIDIDNFIEYLKTKRNYSQNGIKSVMTALKSYFKFCKSRDYILKNFLEGIPIPAVEKKKGIDITMAEFQDFLKVADKKHKALLLFMLDSGARVSEIEIFNMEDINWLKKKVTIHGAKMKNIGGRKRDFEISISELTLNTIKNYIEKYRGNPVPSKESAIFLNEAQTRLKNRQIRNIIQNLRQKLKMTKKVTAHSFRRACARMLWESGMLIEAISEHLGHENIQTTWGYINVKEQFSDQQYRNAHPFERQDIINNITSIIEVESK